MKRKVKITSGSVSIGKVTIPIGKYFYDKDVSDELTKIAARRDQPKEWSYPYICVRDLNRAIEKYYPPIAQAAKCMTWSSVIDHLDNYVQFRNGYDYDTYTIKSAVKDFFAHMPFIDIQEGELDSILNYEIGGYCCEDCDGSREEYNRTNLMTNMRSYYNMLKNYNIEIIIK